MHFKCFSVKPKTSGFGTVYWEGVRSFICPVPLRVAPQGFWHGWQADERKIGFQGDRDFAIRL
jgi:hypothetical protein